MKCIKCNFENPEGSVFCSNCGNKLEAVVNESAPVQNTVPETNVTQTVVNNTPKKSNTALIIIIIVFVLLIAGMVAFILLYPKGDNSNKNNVSNTTTEVVENNNTSTSSTTTESYSNSSSSNSSSSTNSTTSTSDKETVIGNDEMGYLTLPGDHWVKASVVGADKNAIQYANGLWIVSLNVYDDIEGLTAEYAAKAQYLSLQENNTGYDAKTDLTIAKTKLLNYEAFQVYCFYTSDSKWFVQWNFEAEDGKVHIIEIEGTDRNSDYFDIPNTFKLKK